LIETHGADVNLQDDDENTPLHDALSSVNANWDVGIAVLTYLINQKNVNVNIEGEKGYTLLHTACTSNLSGSGYFTTFEDGFTDSDHDLPDVPDAKTDTFLSQIVEVIAERYVQVIFEGGNLTTSCYS